MVKFIEKSFGFANGREARLFRLDSPCLSVSFTDFGAAIADITVRDRNGKPRSVVLGYPDAAGYAAGSCFIGAAVGRYAGRIGGAAFTLGGKEFRLPANDGRNHLHGGFSKRFYEVEKLPDGLRFDLVSPDGDEGFPGELRFSLKVSLYENTLRLEYGAEADADTVVNFTNHSYFNLNGGGSIRGHRLKLFADEYAETDAELIPTGRRLPVRGTAYDFTEGKPISEMLAALPDGLDTSFVLPSGGGMQTAAELYSEESGIRMLCRTTQPTVHIYTAGVPAPPSDPPLRGDHPPRFGGICFETQHLPDSPNKPGFPSTVLKKGERFFEATEFVFEAL